MNIKDKFMAGADINSAFALSGRANPNCVPTRRIGRAFTNCVPTRRIGRAFPNCVPTRRIGRAFTNCVPTYVNPLAGNVCALKGQPAPSPGQHPG